MNQEEKIQRIKVSIHKVLRALIKYYKVLPLNKWYWNSMCHDRSLWILLNIKENNEWKRKKIKS